MNSKQEGLTPMESWDAKAEEWAIQVGDEGDMNRRYQSDPVLWRMLGEVSGLTVLDAGCGTGYLAIARVMDGDVEVVKVLALSGEGLPAASATDVALCGMAEYRSAAKKK